MGIPDWQASVVLRGQRHRAASGFARRRRRGTNNVELREDPLYLGLKRPRLTGAAYYEVVDEFVTAMLPLAQNADPVRGL